LRKLLWLVLMVPGLCFATSGAPWPSNPITASPDDVNCNQGGNHITLAVCVDFWSQQSNVVAYAGDVHATSGVKGVRIVNGNQYQGWWYTTANGGPTGYGVIATSNNTNFTGCLEGWVMENGACKLVQASDLTPVYVTAQNSGLWTPSVSFGNTVLPPADYIVTYADFQQTAKEMHAEIYLSLTSKGSANATDAFSIGGLPCTSATNAGGGTMLAGYNFDSTITQTPTVEVSGTQAYFLHWTGTGLSTIKYSDVQNNTVVATSFTYLCQ